MCKLHIFGALFVNGFCMKKVQRTIELRQMFLELADVLILELRAAKPLSEIEETVSVMKTISSELRQLEQERLEINPIRRNV
jgi:hypothetical protein